MLATRFGDSCLLGPCVGLRARVVGRVAFFYVSGKKLILRKFSVKNIAG
jgi:hypothetical protein